MVSQEQVKHIAQLARLGLDKKEIKKMQKELAAILHYIEALKKADVSSVGDMPFLQGQVNITREDIEQPAPIETVKRIANQAPNEAGGYLKVKKVL